MKIALVTDSSADILKDEESLYKLTVVRNPLHIDDEDYIEEETIDLIQFIQRLHAGADVKTSMPRTGDIITTFNRLFDEGYQHIIFVPIMEALSGSYNNAINIASLDEYVGKVTVINAKSVSAPLAFILEDIVALIDKGHTPEAIKALVETEATIDAILLPATLSYLAKGGRISPAVATLGNMVKLVPLLQVNQNGIEKEDTKRTMKKAIQQAVTSIIERNQPSSDYHWALVYGDISDEIKNSTHQLMRQQLGDDIEIHFRKLGSTIMCHTGPNSLAIACSKKLF